MSSDASSLALGATRVNWRRVAAFLGLAFGLTWLLELALYLAGGLASPAVGVVLNTVMLMPALSVLMLGMFVWRDSPLYVRTNRTASRWFCLYFLLMAAVSVVASLAGLLLGLDPHVAQALSLVTTGLSVIGLILLVVLRLAGGKEAFAAVGMAGGKAKYWLTFGLAIGAFFGLQTLLQALLHLGQPVNFSLMAPPGMPVTVLVALALVQGILLGPFLGLVITFGEEYGWRGYLLSELVKLGRVRGAALVGLIWGLWHVPIIMMGYNYPGYPLLGPVMMTAVAVLGGFVLAYAVFKSGGLWIAAFLHALTNQATATLAAVVYTPSDPVLGSSIGVLGLALGTVVVLLILRDPLWREAPVPAPAVEPGT